MILLICAEKLLVADLLPQLENRPPTLEQLQKLVGGYIERIPVFWEGAPADLIVNEEGLLRQLPENKHASIIAHQRIVGDAVLLSKEHRLK